MAASSHIGVAGVTIESPAKAYQSGYNTPNEPDMPYKIPVSTLDATLSKLGTVNNDASRSHSVPPPADNAVDEDVSRARNVAKWLVKNQKFLACLWSIGASGWSDACLVCFRS